MKKQAFIFLLLLCVVCACRAQWTQVNETFGGNYIETVKAMGTELHVGTSGFTSGNRVYKSIDGGNTWQLTGYEQIHTFENIGSHLFAAGYGSVYMSLIGGLSWSSITNFGGSWHCIAVKDSILIVGTDGGELYRSYDLGQNWTLVDNASTCNYIYDVAANSTHIFAASCNTIMVSPDDGSTWPVPMIRYAETFGVKDSFIFITGGVLSRSGDNGQSWINVTNNLSNSGSIRCFGVSGSNLLLGTNGGAYCYYSPDNGGTWYPAGSGLTSQVNDFTVMGSTIFAATQTGLFKLDTSQISVVGIKELNPSFSVAVFPNPCRGTIKITSSKMEDLELKIYDITSKQILQTKFFHEAEINTTDIEEGLYIYEITDPSGYLKRGKICKE